MATALEKLASDPTVEVEFGPPICPHCGIFNPEVFIETTGGEGRLADFVIEARCLACHEVMYATVESYSMHRETVTVKREIETRRAGWDGEKNV
jgi:hypothetical protein